MTSLPIYKECSFHSHVFPHQQRKNSRSIEGFSPFVTPYLHHFNHHRAFPPDLKPVNLSLPLSPFEIRGDLGTFVLF